MAPDDGQYVLQFEVAAPAARLRSSRRRRDARRRTSDWFERALALEDERPGGRLRCLCRAIEHDPDNCDAYVNLGRLLHERGELERRRSSYRRARPLRRRRDAAVQSRRAAGGPARAAGGRALSRGARAAPDLADAHYNLARLCENLGLQQEALRHWSAFRKLTGAQIALPPPMRDAAVHRQQLHGAQPPAAPARRARARPRRPRQLTTRNDRGRRREPAPALERRRRAARAGGRRTGTDVVLQEQSTLPLKNPQRYHDNVRLFAPEIAERGARVVLYLTWSRRQRAAGAGVLTHAVDDDRARASARWSSRWARRGTRCCGATRAIGLYADDGSHPTAVGSYLAACMFLVRLFGEPPRGFSVSDRLKIDRPSAQTLHAVASRVGAAVSP